MSALGQINTSGQYINLLKEKDQTLNIIGLKKLVALVDTYWHEISEHLLVVEEFYEDENFPQRQLAAHLASKIYFHLEEHKEALDFAIKSGDYFNINEKSQFTEQLINTCVNLYIQDKQHNYENPEDLVEISEKYEKIVEHVFRESVSNKNYKPVIGIAVETRRLDIIEGVLKQDSSEVSDSTELLNYLFDISMNIVKSRQFRLEILKLITDFYKSKTMTPQDYIYQSLCYFFINDYESVAQVLYKLITSEGDQSATNVLTAYQIAHEISENENQLFINRVIEIFPIVTENPQFEERKTKVVQILTGEVRRKLNKIFLTSQDFSDPALITEIRTNTDQKNSITLNGVVECNCFLQAGTHDQKFLDENIDYLKNVKFWNKFSSVSTLGLIHKGSETSEKQIFNKFIPGSTAEGNQGSNPNANGGALYGMGLLHESSKNPDLIQYYIDTISNPQYQKDETIIHGASLGLGLVGLASQDENIYQQLQAVLGTSQSVSGEAAGISIGLVMAGSGRIEAVHELINFAQSTDRDKIKRACAVAIAMIYFGKEQDADGIIAELTEQKEGILRYGACMTIGMAYVGSGNQKAIKQLLRIAVTDVTDDVRRIAVISLAFVMLRQPEEYLKMVKFLSISYNPHVRYGTAFGIGIVCSGTCNPEAYDLLQPLLKDTTPFVKQAAYLGTAMLFQLSNKQSEPKLDEFLTVLQQSYLRKSEDPIVKLGALLARGILSNGGQNQRIKLSSSSGFPRLGACVAMLAFSHFWHWYPLINFYPLTLQPSAIIGVTQDFKVPKGFQFKSNAKPALTDYIPHIKKDEDNKKEKKDAVNLSTTTKAKARAQIRKEGENSKIDNSKLKKMTSKLQSNSKREELVQAQLLEKHQQMEIEEEQKKEEITSQILNNPARVIERYKKHISFIGGRYKPVIQERKMGIIFLEDTDPQEKEEYIGEISKAKAGQSAPAAASEAPDVEPPEDFIFDINEQQKA